MMSMRSSRRFSMTWKQSARDSSSCSTTTRRSRIASVMTRSTSSSNGCRATSHWPSRRVRIHRSRWRGCAPSTSCSSFVPSTSASPRPSQPPFSTRSCTSTLRPRLWPCCTSAPKAGRSAFTWRRCRSHKRTDRAGFVARFGGASRHIVDYLTEVVLDTLDEKRRQFLLETSVLDAMCGPSLRRGHRGAGLRRRLGRARACQPLPDTARRLPGVVSLPRVVRGRAPEPTAPERSRAGSRRAPAGVRVARPGGPPLRGRASRRCRRRARERDHVGVGRLAPLVRGG